MSYTCRNDAQQSQYVMTASYTGALFQVPITANAGISVAGNTSTNDIKPLADNTYNIGALSPSSLRYKDIYASNGAIQTSDRNMKRDIEPITNALETVIKLQPVSYKFKDGTRTHTGFIAQDCKDAYVSDWAGYIENEGHYGLRYNEFISLNTQSIQELHLIVKQQASHIDELERKQVDLMRTNNELERTQMKTIKMILKLEEKLLSTL